MPNLPDRSRLLSVHELWLVLFASFVTGARYLRTVVGKTNLAADAATVWHPVAIAILDGTPIYTGTAVDNKPPLWQYLNILMEATGHYATAWYLVIFAANAAAAILLYRWISHEVSPEAGLIAGTLYLAVLQFVLGTTINVRSPAIVCLLIAIRTDRPLIKGAAVATAGMLCQYAALAAIIFGIQALTDHRSPRWLFAYISSGVLVVVGVFIPLPLVWGMESFTGGVHYTFFWLVSYSESGFLSPWAEPIRWARQLLRTTQELIIVLAPAALGIVRRLRPREVVAIPDLSGILAFVLLLPLLIKAIPYYWILPLPFIIAYAAETVEWLFMTRQKV